MFDPHLTSNLVFTGKLLADACSQTFTNTGLAEASTD